MTAQSKSNARQWIWLLCLLAVVHVFVFSAAFPFFNNVDEQIHLDLTVKYSQGHIPRSLETISTETIPYAVIYGTHEFVWPSNNFPTEQFPPPWTQPVEKVAPGLAAAKAAWNQVINHETSQPPLYYTLAGLWWWIGKICGFDGGQLLYWLRFLNIPFIAMLVWLGYATARTVFPENQFIQIAVPALIAFFPQSIFYAINNDILSPLTFGLAFLLLLKFFQTETPGPRLGIATGLALAATYLTKISNLPLLVVSGIFIALKIFQLARAGILRGSISPLAALFYCAAIPAIAWLAWTKYNFGDFTGAAAKIRFLGWTYKPFLEWWHHPIFTPQGFGTFLHDLLATFWQGEILWHRRTLALPSVDMVYVLFTCVVIASALINLLPKFKSATMPQREALWFSFACFGATIAFLGFLSIIYDFHDCFYPSTAHPYFTSGRLMLGALIPFLLLFVYGLNGVLKKFSNPVKFLVLAAMILFMLISEITIDWPVFSSAYNWFHM
ncbi:MAG TPA: DUF2142 domain-containing protein [Verrucomicrobiae bacterium]